MPFIILSFQADSKYYEEFNPKEEIAIIIMAQGERFRSGQIRSLTTSTIIFETFVETPFNTWNEYLSAAMGVRFNRYPFHFTIGRLAENKEEILLLNDSKGDVDENTRFTEQIEKHLE